MLSISGNKYIKHTHDGKGIYIKCTWYYFEQRVTRMSAKRQRALPTGDTGSNPGIPNPGEKSDGCRPMCVDNNRGNEEIRQEPPPRGAALQSTITAIQRSGGAAGELIEQRHQCDNRMDTMNREMAATEIAAEKRVATVVVAAEKKMAAIEIAAEKRVLAAEVRAASAEARVGALDEQITLLKQMIEFHKTDAANAKKMLEAERKNTTVAINARVTDALELMNKAAGLHETMCDEKGQHEHALYNAKTELFKSETAADLGAIDACNACTEPVLNKGSKDGLAEQVTNLRVK